MKFPTKRVLPGAAAMVAIAVLAAPAGALGSTATTSATLTAGALAFSTGPSAGNFPSTALTGAAQTIHASFPTWGVNDATGSGAGWHVTFQASQFSTGGATPVTLPASSLVLTAPAVAPATGNIALLPVLQAAPYTLDGGAAVPIVHALALTGQGGWTMTQANLLGGDLALSLATTAAAGTYTSTLTFTLATGP
ncbi:MAG: WxL domain-containing protein [Solirubrobacteraceae bacterium]